MEIGFGLGLRTRLLGPLSAVRTAVPTGVALTFDDGPMPGTTDRVLDVLAAEDVRATFFCVGRNAERHPSLVRRIADEGHSIGSHSFSHAPPGTLSQRQLVQDYTAGQRALENVLVESVPLFRPPYGRLTLGTARSLRSRQAWTWTIDPEDWQPSARSDDIARRAGAAESGDVVLLHDWLEVDAREQPSVDRTATIEALPRIIASLRSKGLAFVPLTAHASGERVAGRW